MRQTANGKAHPIRMALFVFSKPVFISRKSPFLRNLNLDFRVRNHSPGISGAPITA